ncbi:class I SAM-dependent methyltransferase [Actinomycetospora endophytica]|uniref:Class I SAM-dependent methyltransferase n=1 Tax=Actinomycetospora endophytica TaxID=2291215 RepID=A0ABS8PIF2_9PSEU|nr:class I SAM-dependent methyltransferase [Actinomycetospora endophytica]MCD2196764.1 class I SAM-dependent methyltransferase [Actinomycetospora endophytica]
MPDPHAGHDARPARPFVPAMGQGGPLAFYDAMSLLLGARRAHERLVAAAGLAAGQTVLEIGCGTGNLLLAAARAEPGAAVVGLDPDAGALARARHKTRRLPAIRLEQGYADELPHADGSVDRVVSAFMFHHLPADGKRAMLAEVRRVLAPGGVLAVLDFDGAPRPFGPLTPLLRFAHRRRGHDHGHDHGHGHDAEPLGIVPNDRAVIRELIADAGFDEVAQVDEGRGHAGAWTIQRAVRPRD